MDNWHILGIKIRVIINMPMRTGVSQKTENFL